MIYASPPVPSTPMRDRALTVLVRGFDAKYIGEDELLQHMAKVGTVERVKIVVKEGDGRDHAFVDYFKEDAAKRAVAGLNFSKICTHSKAIFTLRVYPRNTSVCAGRSQPVDSALSAANTRPSTPPAQQKQEPRNLSVADVTARLLSVKVSGFDANLIGEDELIEHMRSVGTVERVKIVDKNGHGDHAFVWYLIEEAAKRAVAVLNDSTVCTRSQAIFTLRVWIPSEWQRVGGHGSGGGGGFSTLSTPPKPPAPVVEAALGELGVHNASLAADVRVAVQRFHQQKDVQVNSELSSVRSGASTPTAVESSSLNVVIGDEVMTTWSEKEDSLNDDTFGGGGADWTQESHDAMHEQFLSERSNGSSNASTASGATTTLAAEVVDNEKLATWSAQDDTWRMPTDIETWSAHDVGGFCKAIGLSAEIYKEIVDNLVDGKMLAEITDEELISEIKMKPLQIKRLRRELKELHA